MLPKSPEDRPGEPEGPPQPMRPPLRTSGFRDGREMPVPHVVPAPDSPVHPATPGGGQEYPEAGTGQGGVRTPGVVESGQLTDPLPIPQTPRAFIRVFLPLPERFVEEQLIRPQRRIVYLLPEVLKM